jgi:hypothetical protein
MALLKLRLNLSRVGGEAFYTIPTRSSLLKVNETPFRPR